MNETITAFELAQIALKLRAGGGHDARDYFDQAFVLLKTAQDYLAKQAEAAAAK